MVAAQALGRTIRTKISTCFAPVIRRAPVVIWPYFWIGGTKETRRRRWLHDPRQTSGTVHHAAITDTESTAEQPVRQSQRTQAQLQLRVHYSAWDSGSQTIPGVTTYNQYAQAFHRGPPGSSWYKVVPGPPVNSGCTLKLKEKNVSADTVATLYLEATERSAVRRRNLVGTALEDRIEQRPGL
ncbi:hypothetical protein EG328_002537 [Venturia inaequalis]|uniref:Uncharacterized protein n=1 Tax=Venturia inaequalis TaxID=5025 RepID=A0A8H3ZEU4_VENIN|nr:hypothetical protein EG328_002537 [Venturia inaequalis]KAE9993623.1 hypothetical protein EG327_004144 [Venturia inaequalis]